MALVAVGPICRRFAGPSSNSRTLLELGRVLLLACAANFGPSDAAVAKLRFHALEVITMLSPLDDVRDQLRDREPSPLEKAAELRKARCSRFVPTAAERQMVQGMAAVGVRQDLICNQGSQPRDRRPDRPQDAAPGVPGRSHRWNDRGDAGRRHRAVRNAIVATTSRLRSSG